MPALVSAIVVNWNGRSLLERCLASLSNQTYPAVEVVVVDNGSMDGSAEWVAAHFPSVRLIENTENRGFAAANNQGIRAARGAYLALLNNDAWAEPDWLAELVQAVERGPRIGMVASKMLFVDRPEMINSTGICVDRCGITWDRGGGQADRLAGSQPGRVLGPCAGAALYRQEMLDDIGLFDEDFFAYLEDVDLAWRARWRGWQATHNPNACVYHAHSATAREGSPFKNYLLARNKIHLLTKNYPWPHLLFFLPLIFFYESLSLGYTVVNDRNLSALRGRIAGLRTLPQAWKKRGAFLARPHVPAGEVFLSLEPVSWPWEVYRRYRHVLRPSARLPGELPLMTNTHRETGP